MMRDVVVVAIDSFKGGLSAIEACRAVEAGLQEADPSMEVRLMPMADGGEGTAKTILAARAFGEWIVSDVAGPLPDCTVEAGWAWFNEDWTAVVEMATANGLPLLAPSERNPLLTSTYGTGQIILEAARRGARHILLALGGSATVDGGVGAAMALGWRFLDKNGADVPKGGGSLRLIDRIVVPEQRQLPRISVLCDVINTISGPQGAAAVFGPQKGATGAMVTALDAGLEHLAERIQTQLGIDILHLEGGGSAGGLGAGAVAFMGATLEPGVEMILRTTRFAEALRGADLCITGEGCFDIQSLNGKVVSGVAAEAQKQDIPVTVFAGCVDAQPFEYQPYGIKEAIAIHPSDMPLREAMEREAEMLRETAIRWMSEETQIF